MTKQLKDAALIALDALDIAQALMEASRSNHHAKTLAAYNALRLALAAPQPEQAEPIEDPVTVPRGLLGAACSGCGAASARRSALSAASVLAW